jgi:hypothetical protein
VVGLHRIENAFYRLKDFRRIATRYGRLARNYLASICLVAAIVWWIYCVLTPVHRRGVTFDANNSVLVVGINELVASEAFV